MSPVLQTPDLSSVRLDDPSWIAATDRARAYLLSLSAEKLLFEFYRVAGLPPTTDAGYGGWERSDAVNFRGHTLGHYLSALAASHRTCHERDLRASLLAEIQAGVTGLERCQDAYAVSHPASSGYVSAFRESVLDQVQGTGESDENVLVPWYDLHKVLAGLLDVHELVDGALGVRALGVAIRFGLSVHRRVAALPSTDVLLRTEYGGMNEALYRLLAVTGDVRFREAAEAFDETDLFEDLAAGRDVLPGRHANTTIPKLIGALARYRVLSTHPEAAVGLTDVQQDKIEMYRVAAVQFFDIVLRDHTYVTGANSQAEHFHAPGSLAERAARQGPRGNAETAETCNVYNMRRLARGLYELTGESRYADYDELALRNVILASQHPERGTTTYFNPLGPGYHKVVNRPFDEFWCCTGTGMESFAALGRTLYALDGDDVRVDGFHSSTFTHDGLRVVQVANLPADDTVVLRVDAEPGGHPHPVTLRLRVPDWADDPVLDVDGRRVTVERVAGYVTVEGMTAGSTLRYRLPARLTAHPAPDDPTFVAFRYGPEVLSAGLGPADTDACEPTGILVRISDHDPGVPHAVRLPRGTTVEDVAERPPLVRLTDGPAGTVRFGWPGALDGDELVYAPHHTRWDERYAVYLTLVAHGSRVDAERSARAQADLERAAATVDELTVFDGNNFENARSVRSERSRVGTWSGRTYRAAEPGGWFSHVLGAEGARELALTLRPADGPVSVCLDDGPVIEVGAAEDAAGPDGLAEVRLPLDRPARHVTVRVSPVPGTAQARLFGVRTVSG